jgi:phosphate transport system permease protein
MQNQSKPVESRSLVVQDTEGLRSYIKSGQPWVWLTAAAISVCFIITVSLLGLTAARGLPHFWPAKLLQADYQRPGEKSVPILAEVRDSEEVSSARLKSAGYPVDTAHAFYERVLLKVANRDLNGADFQFVLNDWLVNRSYPDDATVFERVEWGDFHGVAVALKKNGVVEATGEKIWSLYPDLQDQVNDLRDRIRGIEKKKIGRVNYLMDRLRLDTRRLQLKGKTPQTDADAYRAIEVQKQALDAQYQTLRTELDALNHDMAVYSLALKTADGQEVEMSLSKIMRGYRPNHMSVIAKTGLYFEKLWEFVSADPREANTEGGIFPAIFGTVMMVLLMSVFVTPFGILAALYLREYAKQGVVTQIIRIAVNNLAGVPSIVYGMFGLGFFVYFLGGSIDRLFYPEMLPSPTFGTPGILWASLTLAILTLPVVIVATEEGLTRIPRSIREASLALGATKAETLWRVVLPMASPAMMTGLILAIARAAGEVAPLMLVGVVKLAPTLPLDGNFPFVHLERKFMHLGFHIYDVGFQSPNVEAARPLVYATSFLLVMVIILLNIAAIRIRNQLRERYKALEH